jgi:transposase-like protein
MAQYKPCPKCASDQAEKVNFTWWGGVLGPSLFHHVKCTKCSNTFNGQTGKSNQQAITAYVVISTVVGLVVIVGLRSMRSQGTSTAALTATPIHLAHHGTVDQSARF